MPSVPGIQKISDGRIVVIVIPCIGAGGDFAAAEHHDGQYH